MVCGKQCTTVLSTPAPQSTIEDYQSNHSNSLGYFGNVASLSVEPWPNRCVCACVCGLVALLCILETRCACLSLIIHSLSVTLLSSDTQSLTSHLLPVLC